MTDDRATTPILVVDLDGTLIRSDMLYESFWAGFARDWTTPFTAIGALIRGRAALKAELARAAAPDIATLPYNPEVIELVTDWRARGGRTALVTAADSRLAGLVADHLGIFDETHASDGTRNLKGAEKAALLDQQFGPGGYVYVGDSTADLAVWARAADAITVDAPQGLRRKVEALHPTARHLGAPASTNRALLNAMRPHQWLKNLLVLFPVIAAHGFTPVMIAQSVIAFFAFSLVASSVYLLNDLLDIRSDRAHPRKRMRPMASGALKLQRGMMMIPILLFAGLVLSLFLPAAFLVVLTAYYLLTIAYSLWLKRQPIIDIVTLAALYTLRVMAGGAATELELSVWMLAFSVFLFLSLAAVKRQAELVDLETRGADKTSGRGYRVGDLATVSQMATASGFVSVLVLMLYLNEPTVRHQYSQPAYLWGAGLALIFWISRTVLLTARGQMHDDPIVFAARDKVSLGVLVLIVALFAGATL
ncbi:MAG: UbiA family prenyltransferase [Paracoccaceae bacterium]